MTYETGHAKRNTQTGEVAVRTVFPVGDTPQQQMMEWLCAAPNTGPRNTWTQEVEGTDWTDLYVPTPATGGQG
jgi:hypothetical protein